MSHPHILPLFDSGTVDGFLFYVMPYIQGETIREKLTRETQFGVDEAVLGAGGAGPNRERRPLRLGNRRSASGSTVRVMKLVAS